MMRRIRRSSVLLAVLAGFLAPSMALASPSGGSRQVEIAFLAFDRPQTDGCHVTRLVLEGAEYLTRGLVPSDQRFVEFAMIVYSICSGDDSYRVIIHASPVTGDEFTMSRDFDKAHLATTVTGVEDISGRTVSFALDVHWESQQSLGEEFAPATGTVSGDGWSFDLSQVSWNADPTVTPLAFSRIQVCQADLFTQQACPLGNFAP